LRLAAHPGLTWDDAEMDAGDDRRGAARRLWQPPSRFEDRPNDRRVTFLELFFDLVFVVVISQLARSLAANPTWSGVGWFVFLFYAVWSSWINGTLYHDLHGTNDVSARVFTFLQMLAVAVMAVFIGDVPGEGAAGFALAYAANTAVLVVLWFRTVVHDPTHTGAYPYSGAYLISTVLFAVSAATAPPVLYWLWAVALAVEMLGLVLAFHVWTPPASQGGDAVIAATPSLIERLGLFVIIVLGEVIVGAVNGMADLDPISVHGIVIGLLGVMVAIGLWWIYFDLVSDHPPDADRTQLWLYLHLPLVVAMAAGGAGVLNTVEHTLEPLPDRVRWLLVGALAVAVVSVTALTRTLHVRRTFASLYRSAAIAMCASAVLIVGVGFTGWGPKGTLAAMVVLLGLPIAIGVTVWVKRSDAEDVALE
jgi:low temperature requirement protein LtrA